MGDSDATGDEPATGANDHKYTGIVSTRGHFKTTGPVRPFLGVKLADGHRRYSFNTEGTIPGYTDDPPQKELAVFVHGFNNSPKNAKEIFDQVAEALQKNEYSQPLVGYSWDSLGDARWYQGVDIAWRNGLKLANFLYEYKQRNPAVTVRLIAHSLGSQLVLSALGALERGDVPGLDRNSWTHEIDSVSLVGAAVDRRAPLLRGVMYTRMGNYYTQSQNTPYGPVIEDVVGRFHNYYSDNDGILASLFRASELMSALGQKGANKAEWTAFNFYDHDVTASVSGHSKYYRPGEGCMDQVVDDWTSESPRFRIVNKNSGLSLAIDHDSNEDGVNVVQHEVEFENDDPDPADWKYWRVNRLGDGEYYFAVVETDKVLDVKHRSKDDNANIHQWKWHKGNNQRWTIQHHKDDTYAITNVNSGKVADVEWRSKDDGANVHQYHWWEGDNQLWYLLRYTNEYKFENVNSGKVVEVAGGSKKDDANVYQWNWLGRRNQRWRIEYLRDREYRIVNVNSGKVLDVEGKSKKVGANVHQWHWHGDDNQRWYVQDAGDGQNKIVNKNSGLVLEINQGKTGKRANVKQGTWDGGKNQRFWITTC